MFVLRTAAFVIAATVFVGGALAQTKPPAPAKAKPAATRPAQNQSWLYLDPSSADRKTPNYVTTGSRGADMPYYNTNVDATGMRQIPRL
jgi:hypothetical protein